MTEPPDPAGTPERAAGAGPGPRAVDWAAVAWGAAIGAAILAVAATLWAVLDREFADLDETGWVLPLFLLVVAAYAVAGSVAVRLAADDGRSDAPLTHGALAGLGAFLVWIPVRVAIWIVRDEDRGLVGGSEAALRPGQVFGQLVIAAGIGMLAGYLTGRSLGRRARPDPGARGGPATGG